jgi:predicted house-cleaning NTP pyrophosphatase (Maf/HAM1 superfamily)
MKIIRVTDKAHQSVKLAAVKAGVTTSDMASHLIIEADHLLSDGKLCIPKPKGGQS